MGDVAARNVPMRTIKEPAAHRAVETTMRYLGRGPRAIRALEVGGDVGETGEWREEDLKSIS